MAKILNEKFRDAIQRIASPYDEEGHLKTKKYYTPRGGDAIEEFDAESAILDVMTCANLSGVVATLGIAYLDEEDKRKREGLKQRYRYAKARFYSDCIDDKDKESIEEGGW